VLAAGRVVDPDIELVVVLLGCGWSMIVARGRASVSGSMVGQWIQLRMRIQVLCRRIRNGHIQVACKRRIPVLRIIKLNELIGGAGCACTAHQRWVEQLGKVSLAHFGRDYGEGAIAGCME